MRPIWHRQGGGTRGFRTATPVGWRFSDVDKLHQSSIRFRRAGPHVYISGGGLLIMSESSTAMRPSRGKVWRHLRAGDAAGRPLAEWGYRTPRFPQGVKRSDLAGVTPKIRRETMIVWFLANHVPAKGPYFGFAQARGAHPTGELNTAEFNELPLNGSVEIIGFDQGRFFSGGTAADLLKAEFGNVDRLYWQPTRVVEPGTSNHGDAGTRKTSFALTGASGGFSSSQTRINLLVASHSPQIPSRGLQELV